MNESEQIMQTKTQLISYRTKHKQLSTLLSTLSLPHAEQLKTLKIMHSQKSSLASIKGLDIFPNLEVLNLKSNGIGEIAVIGRLAMLRELDLSSNRLTGLKGIEGCTRLERAVLCNNAIERIGELGACGNLVYVDLANNQIADERQLRTFSKLKKLQQVWLQKKSVGNPVCQKNRQRYLQLLNNLILCECKQIQKVDGKSPSQIIRSLSTKNVDISNEPSGEQENVNNNTDNGSREEWRKSGGVGRYGAEVDRFLGRKETARRKNMEYEAILGHKEEVLDDLRTKVMQLETTNAQQYKELIKKQAENERIYGQLSQLSRQLQSKDGKLSQSQKRTEKLLQTIAQLNKSIQHKNSTVESLNKSLNDLKIENAEYRALTKDYEKRMSELQNKTFAVAEERAIRGQELKRHNKELYEQNMGLVNDVSSLKERVRELTQLLREWEYKYESKVRDLKTEYEGLRDEVQADCEHRLQAMAQQHETEIKEIDQEMRQKLTAMEEEYQVALEQTIGKYKALRKQNQQKTHQETQLKAALRDLLTKNKDSQNLTQELQTALRRLKSEYETQLKQRERLFKENQSLRMNKEDHIRKLGDQLSKASYERASLEKLVVGLRESNLQLQAEVDRFTSKEKEWEDREEEVEDLEARVKSQEAMLEDKNQTIEQLKAQIENLKRKDETEANQTQKKYDQLRKKYDNLKQKMAQMQAHANQLLQQNEILKQKQNESEQRQKQLQKVSTELDELTHIIESQGKEIQQKQKREEQLIAFIQQIRTQQTNRLKEMEQVRREVQRGQIEMTEKERKWRKERGELERDWGEKVAKLEAEIQGTRAMKKKLELFSKEFLAA